MLHFFEVARVAAPALVAAGVCPLGTVTTAMATPAAVAPATNAVTVRLAGSDWRSWRYRANRDGRSGGGGGGNCEVIEVVKDGVL